MRTKYQIKIIGFEDPKTFVKKWSSVYFYKSEPKYNEYIYSVFDDKNSFIKLFQWKNGTGEVIYNKKMKVVEGFYEKIHVLRQLRINFNWEQFETEFQPTKSSPIWKIFLLHLINPSEFPIFDQHVFRFYNFQKDGLIEEISTRPKVVFETYKQEYKPWFNSVQKEFNLDSKQMDQSFFSFGQVLKNIKGLPIEICY